MVRDFEVLITEKLSESISKAFGLFQEQIKQERLEEETRILSSETFIEKIDELIKATRESKTTLDGQELKKSLNQANQVDN